ncbi:hypothetical protein pb186bvf_002855 [Paramecium bursaria]
MLQSIKFYGFYQNQHNIKLRSIYKYQLTNDKLLEFKRKMKNEKKSIQFRSYNSHEEPFVQIHTVRQNEMFLFSLLPIAESMIQFQNIKKDQMNYI